MTLRWWKVILIVAGFLLLAAFPLARQFESGWIEGLITNDNGSIANASVEAQNIVTDAVVRVQSDVHGQYVVPNLRPGRYSLRIEAPGHLQIWIPLILVERGRASHRDIHLGTLPITS